MFGRTMLAVKRTAPHFYLWSVKNVAFATLFPLCIRITSQTRASEYVFTTKGTQITARAEEISQPAINERNLAFVWENGVSMAVAEKGSSAREILVNKRRVIGNETMLNQFCVNGQKQKQVLHLSRGPLNPIDF